MNALDTFKTALEGNHILKLDQKTSDGLSLGNVLDEVHQKLKPWWRSFEV